jgi:hypothetical protein
MTSAVEETPTHLTNDELTIAAVLDVIADATKSEAVRRTMLLAILEAVQERPAMSPRGLVGNLDREQVSDVLLTLRARRLAVLDEAGFKLTESGEREVERGRRSGPLAPFLEELKGLVGTKLQEWSIAV